MLAMKRNAAGVVQSATRQVKYIAMQHGWLAEYTGREMGKIYDCFIAEITKDDSKITYLGCGVCYDNEEFEETESSSVNVTLSILR